MFKELLSEISKELGRRKIPYMIIGGQAVLLYGEPRLTKDIDITLGVTPVRLLEIESLMILIKFLTALSLQSCSIQIEASCFHLILCSV